MSLDAAREELNHALDNANYEYMIILDWSDSSEVIFDWWREYKAWERDDTLHAAFQDDRLTTRFYKREFDAQLDMRAFRGRGAREMTAFGGHKLFVGLKGLAEYTNPDNFLPAPSGMTKRKVELGLYDQSARLLDHRRDISDQVFGKIEDGHMYAFMPLSQPADQEIFQKLNELGKRMRESSGTLYELVREIRSKMTRIKLAQETDMGTNFTAVTPENNLNPKFKYGIGKTTTLPDKVLPVPNTDAIIHIRRKAALNFKSILAPQKGNEITVAYRQHAGIFPLIGKWQAKEGCFAQYRIVGGELEAIPKATIPNRP